jgi:hypothetical protein
VGAGPVGLRDLAGQWGNAAYLLSAYVGGQHVSRDHKGDKGSRDPIVPVPASKQREVLKALNEQVLSDKAFRFSPALLRKLAGERWYHWGTLRSSRRRRGRLPDPRARARDPEDRAQSVPLRRYAGEDPESGAHGRRGERAVEDVEVFRTLTDGIWSELADPPADAKDKTSPVLLSTIRRNLQREHLRKLGTMVVVDRPSRSGDSLGFMYFAGSSSIPADARSLARLHLREIHKRISKVLEQKETQVDDTTRAHLEECHNQIGKGPRRVLDADEP